MAEARMWGPPTFAVAPEPKFADQDIFPGATVEGWLPPFIVPQDALDSVILSYGEGSVRHYWWYLVLAWTEDGQAGGAAKAHAFGKRDRRIYRRAEGYSYPLQDACSVQGQ
jgi:hypothetical protein